MYYPAMIFMISSNSSKLSHVYLTTSINITTSWNVKGVFFSDSAKESY